MADFTIWRFHECNANFLQDFLGDKRRVVFWITAFLLIFYNRSGWGTLASAGTFLLLVETAYIMNRIAGKQVEYLAGWLLLACPGFIAYGSELFHRSSCGLAMAVLAILFAVKVQKLNALNMLFLGLLCAVSAISGAGIGGIILPVICIWIIRNKAYPAILPGLCFSAAAATALLFPVYVLKVPWNDLPRFLLEFSSSPAGDWRIAFLALLSPLYFLALPAFSTLRGRTMDQQALSLAKGIVAAFALSFVIFGFGAVLPFLAGVTAFALDRGFAERKTAERWLAPACMFLFRFVLPLIALAAPFLMIGYHRLHPETAISLETATLCYLRLPAAGFFMILLTVWMVLRRKNGKKALFSDRVAALDEVLIGLVWSIFWVVF